MLKKKETPCGKNAEILMLKQMVPRNNQQEEADKQSRNSGGLLPNYTALRHRR
jgi:hypothetical protein